MTWDKPAQKEVKLVKDAELNTTTDEARLVALHQVITSSVTMDPSRAKIMDDSLNA